jgi:hypothetical protein
MPDRVIYIENINPENYTNLNARYDYYALSKGLGQKEIAREIFGVNIKNNKNMNFSVVRYNLPHDNVAWLVSSNMFKHYYALLLNPRMDDAVVDRDGIPLYTNVCLKCGTQVTSFQPLEKQSYFGYENSVFLCTSCRHHIVKRISSGETSRKKMKRTTLENIISGILDDIGVPYEQEKAFDIGVFTKIVDFYIPCGRLIIEGNGLAFHSTAVSTKVESRYGHEAFFVNVMKDIISAYELTRQGYYVYIITEADLSDIDANNLTVLTEQKISEYKREYLKDDLMQILSYRGCKIKSRVFKF